MQYTIILTPQFEKDMKYYLKKKKYFKIQDDLDKVIKKLEQGILVGDEISNLHLEINESVFKVRTVNSSANIGKSNGFRLIYYAIKNDKEIYLLTVFSKKDKKNLSNNEITNLINKFCIN